jgi:hypothetical protein
MSKTRKLPLIAVCTASFILLIPATIAWLVNLEAAVQIFSPSQHLIAHILPPATFTIFNKIALDLSTVSTFVPLLMLLFLFAQTLRVLRRLKTDPAFAHQLEADPYPPHFGFFLVMLGLAGTLYGLLIGLDISGVSELAEKVPSADSIRSSLDRLLAGTATALLSSLVGLVGAFLAAKPLPWLFRSITGIEADESKRTLSETVERLTEDLRGLSKASRTFAAHLRPESLDGLFARLDRQESAIDQLQQKVSDAVDHLAQIKKGQIETNAKLQKIESLEDAVKALLSSNETTNKHIEALFSGHQQTNRLLEQMNSADNSRHKDTQHALAELTATAKAGQDSFKQNQNTIRKALALYAATE